MRQSNVAASVECYVKKVASSLMDQKATLAIHLQPGSKNNEIVGDRGGVLWVRVKALPVHHKANEALVEWMVRP